MAPTKFTRDTHIFRKMYDTLLLSGIFCAYAMASASKTWVQIKKEPLVVLQQNASSNLILNIFNAFF